MWQEAALFVWIMYKHFQPISLALVSNNHYIIIFSLAFVGTEWVVHWRLLWQPQKDHHISHSRACKEGRYASIYILYTAVCNIMVQWNLSNPVTFGTARLYRWPHYRGHFELDLQFWDLKKVTELQRWPYWGDCIGRFHCIIYCYVFMFSWSITSTILS